MTSRSWRRDRRQNPATQETRVATVSATLETRLTNRIATLETRPVKSCPLAVEQELR